MIRVSRRTSTLLLSLLCCAGAAAEPSAYRDPYVTLSKGARPSSNTAVSHSLPAPERFGPVAVTPPQSEVFQKPSPATFALPPEPATSVEGGCVLTSTLSGLEAKALIAKIATEEDFDLALLNAVAHQESDFRMDQRSPAGALGLMQLMPATAQALGVDPCDPEQNIRGSIKLLRLLESKYAGNIIYMLAAYNAGEDAVDRNGGIPPYRETITYVTRILSNLNDWEIPRGAKASAKDTPQTTSENDQPKPVANRWAQGFVLHVE